MCLLASQFLSAALSGSTGTQRSYVPGVAAVTSLGAFFFFFFKSLLNLLQYCFCVMVWFFDHEACGILAPQPGIEPIPLALEGKVLTTGLLGKSHHWVLRQRCYFSGPGDRMWSVWAGQGPRNSTQAAKGCKDKTVIKLDCKVPVRSLLWGCHLFSQ